MQYNLQGRLQNDELHQDEKLQGIQVHFKHILAIPTSALCSRNIQNVKLRLDFVEI